MIIREKCESLYLKTFQMYLSNWEWYTTNQLPTPVTGIIFPDILQTNNFTGTLNLFQDTKAYFSETEACYSATSACCCVTPACYSATAACYSSTAA